MPTFHLTPTLSEPCPECQTALTIPFVAGRQTQSCPRCNATLTVDLPATAVRELREKVGQVEAMIDAALNRP